MVQYKLRVLDVLNERRDEAPHPGNDVEISHFHVEALLAKLLEEQIGDVKHFFRNWTQAVNETVK